MIKIVKSLILTLALVFIADVALFAQRPTTQRKDKNENTEQTDEKKNEEADTENSDTKPSDVKTTRSSSTKRKSSDNYFDESGGFKHRLWYGGNFTLGFNGSTFGNQFQIGVTPMIGYKIVGGLSVGPRFGIVYNNISGAGFRENWIDYSVGGFTRYKFLQNFLVHAEYSYLSDVIGFDNVGAIRDNRFSPLIGGGYNAGNGSFGYEILLLYDISLPSTAPRSPFDIRFGFTYKF